ncbi:MAG: 23S rRNA (pseudouridine(1915)-N(3))-methyltransferase RlmH [Rickettsiales bacterium]|nr:23S rRNA (pseudouridine(1915)-N(3))-methyltransferase RlmH [Rickettsiales bacterium]
MQIIIAATGKIKKQSPESEIILEYLKRLPWQVSISEFDEIQEAFDCKTLLADKYKGYSIIQLSPQGKVIDSKEFAKTIGDIGAYKSNKVVFLIGGSRGFVNEEQISIEKKISFGKMTFPHKLFRAMLVEQLYRAHTILEGHPYHK